MGEFRMPSLGADMDVGTIVEWRVRPGDTVHRGDIVAVVDTEKSTIEVEVFEDGIVDDLLVEPGVEVPVGTVLARLSPLGAGAKPPEGANGAKSPERAKGAKSPERAKGAKSPAGAQGAKSPESAKVAESPAGAHGAFVRASPRARIEAAARGLDLSTVAGSGPGGAVVVADLVETGPGAEPEPRPVPQAGPAPERTGGPEAADRQAGLRRAIGALMARSKREIPHYYLATTVDFGRARDWLTELNGARPVTERILPAAVLLRATALAARGNPSMNGFWLDGFRPSSAVHLGVAISLRGGGLVAPAIHDADALGLDALMAALRDLTLRARRGTLRSSEMADPTLTVTNLGDQGVDEVFGVIYPPQVALVGFGRIQGRPWAVDGLLGVRPVVRVTLAADHRVSDGHDGARFLADVEHLLQSPEELDAGPGSRPASPSTPPAASPAVTKGGSDEPR